MSGNPPKLNVKFNVIPKTLEKSFQELFPVHTEGLVRAEPGGYVTSPEFGKEAEDVYQMKPRPDDAWVITFLRSGVTAVSELVWLLKNNLNFEEAKSVQILMRTPYPDMLYFMPKEMVAEYYGKVPLLKKAKAIDELPSPRVLRPHLPLDLLPPTLLDTSKVVYLARNPKDLIVSYFYFHKLMKYPQFTGDLEQFAQFFMDDELLATPYFRHVLSAWEKRNHPNMHFMFYEDLIQNLRIEIKKVADFLDKPLTEDELTQLEQHLQLDNFKGNVMVNQEMGKFTGLMNMDAGISFIRKGVVGDWKNHFSPELNAKVDQWISKNLAGTDLKFTME